MEIHKKCFPYKLVEILIYISMSFNPVGLRMAKTQWSFGHSEYSRVKSFCFFFFCHVFMNSVFIGIIPFYIIITAHSLYLILLRPPLGMFKSGTTFEQSQRWSLSRLVIRRAWVHGSGPATFFHWDWSWNLFYGHSLPSADSRREVVSYLRKKVHRVLVNRLIGLSLPRKSVVRLTDRPNMTFAVDRGR